MKVVVQRVKQAKVTIDQKPVGQIGRGLLLLVGLKTGDTLATVEKMANKISKLRIFTDENGKTGRALKDVSGEVLSVSQFTLLANTKKGNRPSFVEAMEPELANKLWQNFNQELIKHGLKVSTGKFGADMQVSLINEGPFTLVLDD